jgi:threonylcarbamoyladenosine tRNA methylthiotransferase MtaB
VDADAPRVAVRTLGCKVNRTESEALAEALLGAGVAVVEDESGADVVVINTCTVTGEADAKARKEVRRALAASAGPVVVTGCLAAIDAPGLAALGQRVVVEAARDHLARRVTELVGATVAQPAARTVREGAAFRTRVMVKVQDGCDARCAYCIVPDARGVPRSVASRDVAARVRSLVANGTPEVVLTGINIGRYADDEVGGLAGLVRLVAATGVGRVRLSSVEPLDLTDALLSAVAESGPVAPHLHVPLQSGCDRTLGAMGRRYTAREYAAVLGRARRAVAGLAVSTDVIVGFPGESDEDFARSLAFAEECGFAKLHVFRYSPRSGTPAASRPDQVAPQVKASRAAAMRALSDRLARTRADSRVGEYATVFVERGGGETTVGTAEDGMRVRLRGAGGTRPGSAVRVRIVAVDRDGVWGAPLER